MTMVKARARRMFTLLLLVVMVSCSFMPAQAAGPETWYYGVGETQVMNITDYNITPVKTIGNTGTLSLVFGFSSKRNGVDEPTWYPPVVIYTEIRNADTGKVLEYDYFYEGTGSQFIVELRVTAGTRIQIFTDVSSQYSPPGPARKAWISYYYMLGNY